METINHECYVSLEVAKLLKEAGFDWKQYSFYSSKGILRNGTFAANRNDKIWYNLDGIKASAPTLDVAQRWLREEKNIDVYIFPTTNTKRECVYQVGINTSGRTLWIYGQPSTAQYEAYEEAQEAGIKKCLTLILKKDENR